MGSLKLYGKIFCIFELLQWPSVNSVTQRQLNFATYSDVRNPLMCGFNVKHSRHVIYNPNVYDLYHDIKRQNQTVLLLWWEALIRKIRFLHKNFQLFADLPAIRNKFDFLFIHFFCNKPCLKFNSTNWL